MATNQPNNLNLNANFKPVLDSIDKLISALNNLEKKLDKTANKLTQVINLRSLDEFIAKLRSLAQSNTAGLLEVAQALSRIGFAAQQVRLLAQADITRGLDNLTKMMETFTKLSAIPIGSNTEALQRFSSIIRSLAVSLGPLNQQLDKLNVGKTGLKIGALALLFQGISLILSKLPGVQEADNLSRVLQRLGIAFGGLGKATQNIGLKQILNLVATIAILAGAVKLISTVAGLGSKAEIFAKVLADIARALGVLNSIANTKRQQKVDLKGQIGFILDIIKAFGSLKGKPIPNVGEALKGISDFILVINRSNLSFDSSKLKGFSGFVKELAKGLRELNSVKVDPNSANAIGGVLSSLGGSSRLAQQVNRNVFNDSFFNTIKTGFGLRFGAVIFDALTALPRQIARGLASSTQLFRNFARDIATIIEDTGTRIRTFGDTLVRFGQSLTRNFGIGKFIQSSAFQAAAGFDEISARLQTFGTLTDEQLAKAQAFSNEIGIKYPLSANEALQATLDLIKAGEDLSSVEFILPSAAELAALSDTGSLETSTRALIGAQGAFSEFAEGVPSTFANIDKAASILAGGADATTASVESLNEGLADVGPVAKTAGLNLLDTVAALGALDQAQLKGSEGGRALRSILNSIFLRKQAREEFAKLNVATINADGSIRNLNDIVVDLNARYKELGFTQADVQRSLGEIAETFGRTGLSVLLARNGFADLRSEIETSLSDPKKSAAAKAAAIMDNLRGDIEQLQGSVETLQSKALLPLLQKVFRPMIQTVKAVVDAIAGLPQPILDTVVNAIALVSAFAILAGSSLIVIGVITRLGGALLTVLGTLGQLITALPSTIAAITAFAGSFASAIFIITGVGAAILAVAAIVTKFTSDIENNVKGAGDAFKNFKAAFQKAFGTIGVLLTKVRVILNSFFATLFSNASPARGGIVANTFKTITRAINEFTNGLEQAITFIDVFTQFLRGTGTQSAFAAYSKSLKELTKVPLVKRLFGDDVTMAELDRFFRVVKTTFDKILKAADDVRVGIAEALFSGDTTKLTSSVRNLFATVFDIIGGFTGIDFASVILAINEGNINKAVKNLADTIFHSFRQFINDNRDVLLEAGAQLLNFIFNPIALPAKIAEFLGLTEIANVLTPISNTITGFFRDTLATVFDIIGGRSISEALLGNFGEGAAPVAELFDNIERIVGDVVSFITTQAIPAFNTFINQISTLWEQVRPGVEAFAQNFLTNLLPGIATFVSTVVIPAVEEIIRVVGEIWDRVRPGVEAFGQWFLQDGLPAIVSFIQQTVIPEIQKFINFLQNIWNFVRPGLEQLIGFIIDNFVPAIQFIGRIFTEVLLPAFANLVQTVQNVGAVVTPIFEGIVNFIRNVVGPIFIEILGGVIDQVRLFIAIWGNVFNTVRDALQPLQILFDTVFSIIGSLIQIAIDAVGIFINVIATAWDIISVPLNILKLGFETIFNAVRDLIQPVIDAITNIVTGVTDAANDVENPLNSILQIFSDVFSGIFEFVSNVILAVRNVTQAIRDAVHEALAFTRVLDDGLNDQIQQAVDLVQNTTDAPLLFRNLGAILSGADPETRAAIETGLNELGDTIFNKFTQVMGEVGGDLESFAAQDPAGFEGLITTIVSSGNLDKAFDFFKDDLRSRATLALQAAFDPQSFDEVDFPSILQGLVSDASQSSDIKALQNTVGALQTGFANGAISAEQMGSSLSILKTRLDELIGGVQFSQFTDVEQERLERLRGLIIGLTGDYGDLTEGVEKANRVITGSAGGRTFKGGTPGGIEGNPDLAPLTDPKKLFDTIGGIIGGIVDGFETGQEVQVENQEGFLQTVNEFGQELEDTAKEIDDTIKEFTKDEARKLEDDLREEQKAREKIDEIRVDALEKEKEKIEDFHKDQIREEEDHRKRLLEIAKSGDAAFNDAIASRDAAAAQAAQIQLREQTQQEKDEFSLNKKRNEENFQIELERARKERDQRILDAQQSLQDLIDKNNRERARRLEDHNEELAELQLHHTEVEAEQTAFFEKEKVAQTNQNAALLTLVNLGMTGIQTAVSGGFGTAAQTATAILGGLINIFNGELQKVNSIVSSFSQQSASTGFGGGKPVLIPPMAQGGSVNRGNLYEVADPDSELLKVGNKTYLIPGRNGVIVPPVQGNRAAAAGGGNISVSFDFGGFQINAPNGNAQEIAGEVERLVIPKITREIQRIRGS